MSDVIHNSFLKLTAHDEDARSDPFPFLELHRRRCPVFWDEEAQAWCVTDWDTAQKVLSDRSMWRDPRSAASGSIVAKSEGEHLKGRPPSILHMNEPEHSRIRRPFARAFNARVHALRPELDAIIDEVVDAAPQSGRFDLIEAIAMPAPVRAIARVLGVDDSRLEDFHHWSEAAILSVHPARTPEQTRIMDEALMALHQYVKSLIAERRIEPRDDFISDLVKLQADGADLKDWEICVNVTALLIGGNLTTTHMIGIGVWLFLTHPDQLDTFLARPELTEQAVEEILRYDAPTTAAIRIVNEDQEIAGCPMKQGQPVYVITQSANRDAARFALSDDFDIEASRLPHMAFGGGTRTCIGAPLARAIGQRSLPRIFKRYPSLTLQDDRIEWRDWPLFRGMKRLRVTA